MKINVAGALMGFLMAMQVASAASLTGRLAINPADPNFPGPFFEEVSQATPIYISGIAGGSLGSEGNGSVVVDYGVLKLGGQFMGRGNTQSSASFRDALTFDVPGKNDGTRILVTFEMVVTGALLVSPAIDQSQAFAGWELKATLGSLPHDISRSAIQYNDSTRWRPDQRGQYVGDAFGTYSATVELRTGGPQQLLVILEGFASTSSATLARPSATYDLGNSVYWGGISSVKLLSGQEVSNYTLNSETGIDYRFSMAPVPEPGSALLLVSGLALLTGAARRRLVKRAG